MSEFSRLLQPIESRTGEAGRTQPEAARAPPRLDLHSNSGTVCGSSKACRGKGCASRRTLPVPPRCQPFPLRLRGHGRAPPSARLRPALWSRWRARACARRRAGAPAERLRPACAVRAGGLRLFEQEGGHISPSRPPPRPTSPGIRRRDSPFPEPGPQRLTEAPPSGAARTRPSSSSPPALQPFLNLHRASTSPCPSGRRGRSPSSDRTKWEGEAVLRRPALDRDRSAK